MNLGEALNQFRKSVQESSGLSSSKLFADDLTMGKLICLLVWSRIRKLWGKRISALNFASVQIPNFKHSTGLSVIYHDQMDIREQASTKFLRTFLFNETFCPELASPWDGHHSNLKPLKVDKLTRYQGFSGFSFPFNKHKWQRLGHFLW